MNLFILLLIHFFQANSSGQEIRYYSTNNGVVSFRSEAPQEIISARSNELRGLVDLQKQTFVFKVLIRTFKGFNNSLQREHFNEKYLESDLFPEASFIGKIIEESDFSKEGTYTIRAKGKLSIHGVEQERIIKSVLVNRGGLLHLESHFNILLTDYNIRIPRVVHEKIASEVRVEILAELKEKLVK